MKHNKHTFIDSKTYEIIPDSKIIEADDNIAEAISVLNKKGYRTEYCCGGHINEYKFYSGVIADKSLLNEEKFKKDYIEYYICDIDENNFKVIYPDKITSIYIKFSKDYKFDNLPEGFKKVPIWDYSKNDFSRSEFDTIEHTINYYQNSVVRDNKDVYNEIIKYNKLLLEWANNLPDVNERND